MFAQLPNAITLAGAGVLPPKVLSSLLKNQAGSFINSLKQRSMTMLRAIYRAIIIGRTRSAAIYLANNLSERQLNDIGHSKWTLVEKSVEATIKDLDAAEKARDQKAIQPAPAYSLAGIWAAFMRKAAI